MTANQESPSVGRTDNLHFYSHFVCDLVALVEVLHGEATNKSFDKVVLTNQIDNVVTETVFCGHCLFLFFGDNAGISESISIYPNRAARTTKRRPCTAVVTIDNNLCLAQFGVLPVFICTQTNLHTFGFGNGIGYLRVSNTEVIQYNLQVAVIIRTNVKRRAVCIDEVLRTNINGNVGNFTGNCKFPTVGNVLPYRENTELRVLVQRTAQCAHVKFNLPSTLTDDRTQFGKDHRFTRAFQTSIV